MKARRVGGVGVEEVVESEREKEGGREVVERGREKEGGREVMERGELTSFTCL